MPSITHHTDSSLYAVSMEQMQNSLRPRHDPRIVSSPAQTGNPAIAPTPRPLDRPVHPTWHRVIPKRPKFHAGQRVMLLKPKYLRGKLATILRIRAAYVRGLGFSEVAYLDIDGLGRYRRDIGTEYRYTLDSLKIKSGFGSFGAWVKAQKEDGLNV